MRILLKFVDSLNIKRVGKRKCFHGTFGCLSLSDLKNRSWKHGRYWLKETKNSALHISVHFVVALNERTA